MTRLEVAAADYERATAEFASLVKASATIEQQIEHLQREQEALADRTRKAREAMGKAGETVARLARGDAQAAIEALPPRYRSCWW